MKSLAIFEIINVEVRKWSKKGSSDGLSKLESNKDIMIAYSIYLSFISVLFIDNLCANI